MLSIVTLPDAPIVVVTCKLNLDVYLMQQPKIEATVAAMADQSQCPVYKISDLSYLPDLDYCDILLWLEAQRLYTPGSFRDPRVRPIIVGTHPLIAVGIRKIRQMYGISVQQFATLDEALAHAHAAADQYPIPT